ncbi:MAG: SUMF1/EgtB/PvdO family nonheme iron enzyme [Verrucomicrobia bacterium]|nr:SUMF1/EgtB/PvdO family nonheme iron enzyme [Verrucomicrobiota bacterium]
MNLDLTRKLALLQATAANLRETSRSFTDTADMFAYRQFQMELAEYLGTHRATGDIPQEPEAFVHGEVDRLEKVLGPVAAFVQEQLALGREILAAKKQSLALPQVIECQAAADSAYGSLVEHEHRLAAGFLNKDLSVEEGGVDLAPDLVAFCKLARAKSPLLQPERAARCQFANGEGPLHAEVVEHLVAVRAACATLLELHAEQAETLQQAHALAETADFTRAAALIERLNPVFTDLPYHHVTEVIDGWRKSLDEVEAKFTRLREQVESPWRAPFAQPWKVPARQTEMEEKLQQFHDHLTKFHGGLESWKNSDFARDGHSLFKKLMAQADTLRGGLAVRCGQARTRALAQLAATIAACVLIANFGGKLLPVLLPVAAVFAATKSVRAAHRRLGARTSVVFRIEADGRVLDDAGHASIRLNGDPVRSGDRIAPGSYQLTLDTSLYEPLTRTVTVVFGRRNNLGVIPVRLNHEAHTNSLGMRFLPVPGAAALFSVWPVRVQDYEPFAQEATQKWPRPKFKQDPTHPAVSISWDDARRFCLWLTDKERRAGHLGERDEYRLPTDLEWSAAVDLGKEAGATPAERDGKIPDMYPWGKDWPPPKNVGNYDGELRKDSFDYTSPVGSFPANRHGLHDLGGNVWEWCNDSYDGQQNYRVLRGASWHSSKPHTLLSSARLFNSPGHRVDIVGFRCVLEARRPSPVFAVREKQQAATPATPSAPVPVAPA